MSTRPPARNALVGSNLVHPVLCRLVYPDERRLVFADVLEFLTDDLWDDRYPHEAEALRAMEPSAPGTPCWIVMRPVNRLDDTAEDMDDRRSLQLGCEWTQFPTLCDRVATVTNARFGTANPRRPTAVGWARVTVQ